MVPSSSLLAGTGIPLLGNNDLSLRWKSSSSSRGGGGGGPHYGKKGFRPRRTPNQDYLRSVTRPSKLVQPKKEKGPREPNDISTPLPRVDLSNIAITDVAAEDLEEGDDVFWQDPLMAGAVQMLKAEASTGNTSTSNNKRSGHALDIEGQLRMMDFFTSAQGSTEDLVGSRRAAALEAYQGEDPDDVLRRIDELVHQERIDYMDLPPTEPVTLDQMQKESSTGSTRIPPNQLAHGDWYVVLLCQMFCWSLLKLNFSLKAWISQGILSIFSHREHFAPSFVFPLLMDTSPSSTGRGEMLIRTDRVCKMWRGGRIESYRALVVGGNLRGCGGFGIGKAFEPEDAVEIACRMAKRNIFFVEPYRGRGLTRDLVGRQNSCRVYLRATDNGLRGNPLSCEILKLMGITNVVAKAHGSRNHFNVCRATFKALLTHESLEEIAMKRGIRLINLQKAKRLRI